MINITINGEATLLADTSTLAQLLAQRGCGNSVVTAVNDTFVPRSRHSSHVLREGDRVELLSPMEGG